MSFFITNQKEITHSEGQVIDSIYLYHLFKKFSFMKCMNVFIVCVYNNSVFKYLLLSLYYYDSFVNEESDKTGLTDEIYFSPTFFRFSLNFDFPSKCERSIQFGS